MGTQPSDQTLNRRTTDHFGIVMKTSPLLSALLLLGFASTGMATWDWSLSNIANFKTEISGNMMVGCLGEAKANSFSAGLSQCNVAPNLKAGTWMLNNAVDHTDLTCGQIKKFRKLIKSELCAANVCQTTRNTKQGYGNLDWARLDSIFNGTVLDASSEQQGEIIHRDMVTEIKGCKNEAMRFLEENIVNIMQTLKQGARQKADGSRLGCNNGEGIKVELGNQKVGCRKVLKRVLITNCVRRAFVNQCAAAMAETLPRVPRQ